MRNSLRPTATIAALAILVLIGGRASARSQAREGQGSSTAAGPAQSWLRIDTVQVKPEMWTEYRTLERDEVIPALRKSGVRSRAAWVTAEFGATYEIVLVRPVDDFADYDTGDTFSRALGPREAERLRERLRRTLISRDSAAILQRSDLGAGETGRPFAVVTTVTVAPGRDAEYEEFLRGALPGARKAGIVFGVYQRIFGQRTAWLLVQNLDSLRELAQTPGDLFPFGAAPERKLQTLSGVVTGVERKVFRFDPELSFSFPTPAASGR